MTVNVATQEQQTARTSLRTRVPSAPPKRRSSSRGVRARVVAAFRKAGVSIGERQAFERSKEWCRANGGAWAQSLD